MELKKKDMRMKYNIVQLCTIQYHLIRLKPFRSNKNTETRNESADRYDFILSLPKILYG